MIPWIPIVEQSPPERQVVIVCQWDDDSHGIFAGWLRTSYDGVPRWWTYTPETLLKLMGDARATDWWLPLPAEHPQHGCVRGGYPA